MAALQIECPYCKIPISFAEYSGCAIFKCPVCNKPFIPFKDVAIINALNKIQQSINTDLKNNSKDSIFTFFEFGEYLAGIISGVYCIVISDDFSKDTNSFQYERYGGDAYTGIQNAQVNSGKTINHGFGSLLFGLGIALIAFFSSKLCRLLKP